MPGATPVRALALFLDQSQDLYYAWTMAPEIQDPEPGSPLADDSPERLRLLQLAEQEAERISAIMGPEWAAGMYD